uniref:Aminomethyltransferase n=1 Tax=Candidatus Kentrum sp. LPFa TaxID=2126335 RepID=A0A450WIL8_9GAMM|nr:MAG: aminomethyltransferase [Candidatus Kentron sp. LPFa]
MKKRTPLYYEHSTLSARMVDFAGWDMPLHYGSQIEEHHRVRRDAGMFDISHMTVLDLGGEQVRAFLRYLLANDVAKLKSPGQALYSCMLNEGGGIMDDLIVYFLGDDRFRMVVNAATRDKDLAWIREQGARFSVTVWERSDLAMVAVQGSEARDKVHRALGDGISRAKGLDRFFALECGGFFIARTGYTGEDGYEIMAPAEEASRLWRALLDAEVVPAGLGARDTLRLEAGMNLYGQDMTEDTTPLESGLGWTVAFEPARDFIGRKALEEQRGRARYKRVGLVLEGKGIPRPHQRVMPLIANGSDIDSKETEATAGLPRDLARDLTHNSESEYGKITSGGFSPTLGKAIALARAPVAIGERCAVEIRGKWLTAKVVRLPFV